MDTPVNLTGQLLVAMPNMHDRRFDRSVILVCEHNKDGALGLVVNSPIDVTYADLLGHLGHLDKHTASFTLTERLLWGGPVERDRGFVVHRTKGEWSSTFSVSDSLFVTTSQDILMAIAGEEGPRDAYIAFGCARWYRGQLEQELADNVWLSVPMSDTILFDSPFHERWIRCANLMGVDFNLMHYEMGHA